MNHLSRMIYLMKLAHFFTPCKLTLQNYGDSQIACYIYRRRWLFLSSTMKLWIRGMLRCKCSIVPLLITVLFVQTDHGSDIQQVKVQIILKNRPLRDTLVVHAKSLIASENLSKCLFITCHYSHQWHGRYYNSMTEFLQNEHLIPTNEWKIKLPSFSMEIDIHTENIVSLVTLWFELECLQNRDFC